MKQNDAFRLTNPVSVITVEELATGYICIANALCKKPARSLSEQLAGWEFISIVHHLSSYHPYVSQAYLGYVNPLLKPYLCVKWVVEKCQYLFEVHRILYLEVSRPTHVIHIPHRWPGDPYQSKNWGRTLWYHHLQTVKNIEKYQESSQIPSIQFASML